MLTRSANLPLIRLLRRHPLLAPRIVRNQALARLGRPVLRAVEFCVTLECAARCEHCFIGDRDRHAARPLTREEIRGVVHEATALGALVLHFSGGEPLLRDDLDQLLRDVPRNRAISALTTSGQGLTRARVEALAQAGLDVMVVSLEGDDADAHDRFRGLPGGHARAVAGLGWARAAGLHTVINFMVTQQRLRDRTDQRILALARALGAQLNVSLPASQGRWQDRAPEQFDVEARAAFAHLLGQPGVRWCGDSAYLGQGCRAGSEKLSVGVEGEVIACALIPQPGLGNVRDAPLSEIWKRARALAAGGLGCPSCEAVPG